MLNEVAVPLVDIEPTCVPAFAVQKSQNFVLAAEVIFSLPLPKSLTCPMHKPPEPLSLAIRVVPVYQLKPVLCSRH